MEFSSSAYFWKGRFWDLLSLSRGVQNLGGALRVLEELGLLGENHHRWCTDR